MPRMKFWQSNKEFLLLASTGGFFQMLRYCLNIATEVLLPNGLPRFLRRRLSSPPPRVFGEAMLCSMCRKIFEVHRHGTVDDPWASASYRHQDDLTLLRRSASSGCNICLRLYEWVGSIEKGSDWSDFFQSRVPWSTIRSHLLKSDVDNHFELVFTIFRWEFSFPNDVDAFHTLTLKIVPAAEIRDYKSPYPIDANPISDSSIDLARFWVGNCNQSHPRCQNFDLKWQPTRLINVGTALAPVAHLIHTSELTEVVKYVTLSHCWGKIPIFRLLKDNIEALQITLPIDRLPPTFQQAIKLARVLGISYLWIDSLCIIQDSDSDWATEAATMGEVYSNYYCNIAGTGFPDSRRGIAALRIPHNLQLCEIQITKQNKPGRGVPSGSYFCLDRVWEDGIVNAPLNRRAWVFQERYLSPRILHFGARQLFWECMEHEACEMFPSALPPIFTTSYKKTSPFRLSNLSSQPQNEISLLKTWCDAVSMYTNGAITKEGDKLVALSGIAQSMDGLLRCEYLAGLWSTGFPSHLLWRTDEATRPESYIAPSWSWASVKGHVSFIDPKKCMAAYVTVLQHEIIPNPGQKFGQVSSGYIRLRGPLTQAGFLESEKKLNTYTRVRCYPVAFRTQTMEPELAVKLLLDIDVFPKPEHGKGEIGFWHDSEREAIGSRVFFLLSVAHNERTGAVAGLILQKTGVKGGFKRLGMFWILENYASLIARHRPALDPDDYEVLDEENGHSTLTIV